MDRKIVAWKTKLGQPALSVLFGRSFAVGPRGVCSEAGPFALQEELVYYPESELGEREGYIRPSVLKRDVDLYPFRARTDLVIQGTVRATRPMRTMTVELGCHGSRTRLSQRLQVSGDRWIERGPSGLRLGEAVAFDEMPLRYDKAYGGTDERARIAGTDRDEARMIYDTVGEEEDREISEFSYPRNPAGKGYVVDIESAPGTPWPNIEVPGELLQLEHIAAPRTAWGARPYPGGFDWFPHAWFPRVAFFGEIPVTDDGAVPAAEVRQGLLPADLTRQSLLSRDKDGFAQGAHPYLWRERLLGDEKIRVTGLGTDGGPLEVALPSLQSVVRLRPLGAPELVLRAELDLVLISGDSRTVTLLWRASHVLDRLALPPTWEQQTSYTIEWRKP